MKKSVEEAKAQVQRLSARLRSVAAVPILTEYRV